MDVKESNIANIVGACCILHNLCEKWGEQFLEEWSNIMDNRNDGEHGPRPDEYEENRPSYRPALEIRNALVQYIKTD